MTTLQFRSRGGRARKARRPKRSKSQAEAPASRHDEDDGDDHDANMKELAAASNSMMRLCGPATIDATKPHSPSHVNF